MSKNILTRVDRLDLLALLNREIGYVGISSPAGIRALALIQKVKEPTTITLRQLESILINEGIIQAAAIEDPDGYDGGKTELAMTIATQQINELLSPL